MKKEKTKKGSLITKTWDRCKSLGRRSSNNLQLGTQKEGYLKFKSNSWPRMDDMATEAVEEDKKKKKKNKSGKKGRVLPEGCFSVYVGPDKQRFVIKTNYLNHPLFKMLLEEAESEFGYDIEGPLVLPCNIEIFNKVLMKMEEDSGDRVHQVCGFAKRPSSYQLLSPSSLLTINHF